MKILFVSQYFYPEIFKGNEIVFNWAKEGHDVTVLTGKPNYPQGKFYKGYNFFNKSEEIIQGVRVIRSPVFPRKNGTVIPLVLNYFSFIFFSFFTVILKLKEEFDVIFVQQLSPVTMALPALWIKRKFKTPIILWVLDLWPESLQATTNLKSGIILNILDKIVKNIYDKSDLILISSRYFKESILNKCKDKNKKIKYFPNWAEDVYLKFELQKETSIKVPIGFNIMFAGNIGEGQGFETILKAAEYTKKKNINWLIVGDGRKAEWIKNEIRINKLTNVFLFGRHPLETMPSFFRKADVMLVSLKDDPIFSLTVPAKVQAYMASKKIILGLLNGEGNQLIIDCNCGFAVKSGDAYTLAEKSIILSKMRVSERKQLEKNSYNFYNKYFEKEKLFEKLEMYLQVVRKV